MLFADLLGMPTARVPSHPLLCAIAKPDYDIIKLLDSKQPLANIRRLDIN